MALNIGYLTSDKTIKGDECFTPHYAVQPLLEYMPKGKKIWCPFDEEWSAFYQTFKEGGMRLLEVTSQKVRISLNMSLMNGIF